MTEEEIKALIRQELPKIIQADREVRDFVLRTMKLNHQSAKPISIPLRKKLDSTNATIIKPQIEKSSSRQWYIPER